MNNEHNVGTTKYFITISQRA